MAFWGYRVGLQHVAEYANDAAASMDSPMAADLMICSCESPNSFWRVHTVMTILSGYKWDYTFYKWGYKYL